MNFLKMFLVLAMLMTMATIALSSTAPASEEGTTILFDGAGDPLNITESKRSGFDKTWGAIRGGARRRRDAAAAMTCDKYPRVCRAKGSPGPDCCMKKCVNVSRDSFNCGKCGKRCKYPQACCKGQCVNLMSNEKHCGGCSNNCDKGSSCTYGMCSYA